MLPGRWWRTAAQLPAGAEDVSGERFERITTALPPVCAIRELPGWGELGDEWRGCCVGDADEWLPVLARDGLIGTGAYVIAIEAPPGSLLIPDPYPMDKGRYPDSSVLLVPRAALLDGDVLPPDSYAVVRRVSDQEAWDAALYGDLLYGDEPLDPVLARELAERCTQYTWCDPVVVAEATWAGEGY